MKALIRGEKETVTEKDSITGINWANGEPLTRPEWAGGPYTLVEDYVEPEEMDGDGHVPVIAEKEEDPEEPSEPVVTIGGKTYTREELRELLNSV